MGQFEFVVLDGVAEDEVGVSGALLGGVIVHGAGGALVVLEEVVEGEAGELPEDAEGTDQTENCEHTQTPLLRRRVLLPHHPPPPTKQSLLHAQLTPTEQNRPTTHSSLGWISKKNIDKLTNSTKFVNELYNRQPFQNN